MNANRSVPIVPAVNHYGEFTARLLQHQEWQREAMRRSTQWQAVRALRHDAGLTPEPLGARRLAVAVGSVLIRAGQRLQGRPRVSAAAAR